MRKLGELIRLIILLITLAMIRGCVAGPSYGLETDGFKHAEKRVLIEFFLGIAHSQSLQKQGVTGAKKPACLGGGEGVEIGSQIYAEAPRRGLISAVFSAGGADCSRYENAVRRRTIIGDSAAMGGPGQDLSVRSLSYPVPPILAEIGADGKWHDGDYLDRRWDPNDPNTYGFGREAEPEAAVRKWAVRVFGVVYLVFCWTVLGPIFGPLFNFRKG